jgi:hypothetical protein
MDSATAVVPAVRRKERRLKVERTLDVSDWFLDMDDELITEGYGSDGCADAFLSEYHLALN